MEFMTYYFSDAEKLAISTSYNISVAKLDAGVEFKVNDNGDILGIKIAGLAKSAAGMGHDFAVMVLELVRAHIAAIHVDDDLDPADPGTGTGNDSGIGGNDSVDPALPGTGLDPIVDPIVNGDTVLTFEDGSQALLRDVQAVAAATDVQLADPNVLALA